MNKMALTAGFVILGMLISQMVLQMDADGTEDMSMKNIIEAGPWGKVGFSSMQRTVDYALEKTDHAGDAEAETAGIEILPETRRRFREFQKACASARTPAEHLRIADTFRNSYFLYHRFGEGMAR